MNVLIAAGGTAGHIFPALALARRLSDTHAAEVRFAGTPLGQEARLVPAAGFAFTPVEAAPFVRGFSMRNLATPALVLGAVTGARPLVDRADVVVGMGGYVSVPVAIAALRGRKRLVLHEQNAIPGLANRALARPARSVALSFGEAARHLPRRTRTVLTGNPVRQEIANVSSGREQLRRAAIEEFDLDAGRKTILIFGGSQGALHLDRAVVEALGALRDRDDLQVLLLAGPAHAEVVRSSLPETPALLVRVVPFLERMELAYALADVAVARAGATSVAELTVCGLPAILVPYPYATGRHQEANARALQRAGAATIVMDEALDGPLLAARLAELVGDEARLATMRERSASWGRPDADEALARVVLEAAR